MQKNELRAKGESSRRARRAERQAKRKEIQRKKKGDSEAKRKEIQRKEKQRGKDVASLSLSLKSFLMSLCEVPHHS